MLNNILKVYRCLTSGKGSFSRWRPRCLLGSFNDYILKTIQRRKLVLVSKRRVWAQGIQYNQCKYRRLIIYWQIQDGGNTNGHHEAACRSEVGKYDSIEDEVSSLSFII